MAKFTEKDNVLEVSFDLALNKQAREEVDVYDIVLKHESGSEENTLVDYELSLKESGAILAVKIPKYYFARLGVYSVAVKLSQRDADALSGRSRIEASQPLCTVISLHRDMESGKTDVELVPFGTTASAGDAEGAAGTTVAFDHSMFNPMQLSPQQRWDLLEALPLSGIYHLPEFEKAYEELFQVVARRWLFDVPVVVRTFRNDIPEYHFGENSEYRGVLKALERADTAADTIEAIVKSIGELDKILSKLVQPTPLG